MNNDHGTVKHSLAYLYSPYYNSTHNSTCVFYCTSTSILNKSVKSEFLI